MCDQGRLDFHFVNSEFRLTDPMVKAASGKHEVTTWKNALGAAARSLEGLKGGEVAIVASARFTNEELFFVKRLAETLGTTLVDVVPRTGGGDNYLRSDDQNPNSNGVRQVLGTEPGSQLEAIRSGVANGSIKGVIALGENLIKAGFAKDDLEKLKAVVSLHILANATAEVSHVVLPGSSYAEKRGSMINLTGRLQRLNKAVKSPGNARDTWEILRDLVSSIGGGNGLHTIEDVFKQLAAQVPAFAGLTLSRIGDQGLPILETTETIPLLEREKERKAKGLIVG
jgi:NADH-quinone oxidoreductase subunit G